MKLEDLPGYYSPKSPGLTNVSASTSEDALSITDVMTVQGMTQNRAEMGFSTSLGKMDINTNDRARATELLTDYVLSRCDRVVALRKLPAETKLVVVCIMTSYAFEDCTRSAANKKQCPCHHEKKFIESGVFTNKIRYPDGKPPMWAKRVKGVYPSCREERKKVREVIKVACPEYGGESGVFTVCKDCRGRGAVIHCEESVKRGVPVIRNRQHCGGRGCERLPSAEAFNTTCKVTNAITLGTWRKSAKRLHDTLVVRFDIEKVWVERQLERITR